MAVTGTTKATLDSAAEQLQRVRDGAVVLPIRADIRKFEDVQTAVNTVVSRLGGLDILINNAGVGGFATTSDMSIEAWNAVIDTNLTGVFHACRAALPHLRVRGGGWILNVSSLASVNPFAGAAAYCASKAGLNAFSEALMQEVRNDGIRVAYVLPGSVDTDFGGRGGSKRDWALSPDDVAQVVADLLEHPARSLPSRVEIRPSMPPKKG